jgi:tetratricopeptide (TPR) repeat protein
MKIMDAETIDALVASGRREEAIDRLMLVVRSDARTVWPLRRLGALLASLGRISEARTYLYQLLRLDPDDVESLWGLYELEQVFGNVSRALSMQERAISLSPIIACRGVLRNPPGRKLAPLAKKCRVLMLCIPGTYQANNPLEYIVDDASIELHKWYLTGGPAPRLPEYDVVFNAFGYAHGIEATLDWAERFLAAQGKPSINAPREILKTSRAAVSERFAHSATVHAARSVRMTRAEVAALDVAEPILLRPLNSQAGNNFAKISRRTDLAAYLASVPAVTAFYHAPYIEYASRDGLYRKYRIVFIEGVPYPVHLAISQHWMVHYYSSAMAEYRWMRDEEAAFLRAIDNLFTGVAAEALREIAASFALEYFAIDCGILADGRVLLFEADTAMIVHMSDPIELYPYKHRYMPRIVDALDLMFSHAMERTERVGALDGD